MPLPSIHLRATACAIGLIFLSFASWADADPPSRVARLGFMSGAVSFSPAGASDWVQAAFNRPLVGGDRLWTDANGRAEIQVGAAMIRMNADTGVSVLNLDDRIAQLQLTEGALNVRVRALASGQVVEVDTPNLAFTLRRPGEYRITADPDGDFTDIVLRKGAGEVYADGIAYTVDARQPYRFSGTGLRNYQYLALPPRDEFDRWAAGRDRAYDQSVSARYVSRDVIGYQDLDANGSFFEETAIWLGSPLPDAVTARRDLLEGRRAFADLLRESPFDLQQLIWTARWITPVGVPKRFDTYFFLAMAPHEFTAAVDQGEAVDLRWITPDQAIASLQILFPTLKNLEAIRGFDSATALLQSRQAADIPTTRPILVIDGNQKRIVLPD